MKFLKSHFATLTLAGTLLASPVALARQGGHGPWRGAHKMEEVLKQLNLTPEQREQIKKIHQDSREKQKAAHLAVKDAHRKLKEGLDKVDATNESLTALHDQVIQATSNMMRLRFENMLAMRAVLTPEQRAKFTASMPPPPEGAGGPDGAGPEAED